MLWHRCSTSIIHVKKANGCQISLVGVKTSRQFNCCKKPHLPHTSTTPASWWSLKNQLHGVGSQKIPLVAALASALSGIWVGCTTPLSIYNMNQSIACITTTKSHSQFFMPGLKTSCFRFHMMRLCTVKVLSSISSLVIAGRNLQHFVRSMALCGLTLERSCFLWGKSLHKMMNGVRKLAYSGIWLNLLNTKVCRKLSAISTPTTSAFQLCGRKTSSQMVSNGLLAMMEPEIHWPLPVGQIRELHWLQ